MPFCCVIDDHAVRGVPVVASLRLDILRVYNMCFNAVRDVPVVATLRLDIPRGLQYVLQPACTVGDSAHHLVDFLYSDKKDKEII